MQIPFEDVINSIIWLIKDIFIIIRGLSNSLLSNGVRSFFLSDEDFVGSVNSGW